MIVLIGANSTLAESLATELVDFGETNFFLVGRNRKKLSDLEIRLKGLGKNLSIDSYVCDFSTDECIKASLNKVSEITSNECKIIVCAGYMIEDANVKNTDEILDSFFVNTILPFRYLESKRNNLLKGRLIVVSSLFSIFEKKGKSLYSLSKRIFYKLFDNLSLQDTTIILMGPMYSPMYKGAIRFYVRPPKEIALSILSIVNKKSEGIFWIPKFWKYLSPILFFIKWA